MTSALTLKGTSNDPWGRKLDESEDDYLTFQAWLQSSSRPPLSGDDAALAMRNDWAERANAFDVADALAQSPQAKLKSTLDSLNGVAMLEAAKMLRKSAAAGETSTLTPKETVDLLKAMAAFVPVQIEAEKATEQEKAAEHALSTTGTTDDLSGLTDEEFETYRKTVEMLERRKK